jgi:CRISPR-associated protein Csb2
MPMLAIAFTFLAGRYHATPWGRHVNEADVAWPPDPWRISRALIAVWHRKLNSVHYPRESLDDLLTLLAQAGPPAFRLPKVAIHAHTRHYMPGKSDKRTLVFDAFVRIANDEDVVVAWPDLTLNDLQARLLDALLENLGFLGRAESWVEARRAAAPANFNCVPATEEIDDSTGEVIGETVQLLAPVGPREYARFRMEKFGAAGIPSGTLGGTSRLSKTQKTLATTLPERWLDALSVDTSELQAAGWSAPPAAVSVRYRRPFRALQTIATEITRKRVRTRPKTSVTTARFALYGKPLPRIEDAVRIGELLRWTAMGCARRLLGPEGLPPELSGHGLDAENQHGHAFWLPDADRNGLIDHMLIHVPSGLSAEAVRVLSALQSLKRDEGQPLRLMLEGIGTSEMLSGISSHLQSASVWQSVTPYLHPWHLKKPTLRSYEATLAAIAEQIRREWQLRGKSLPALKDATELQEISLGGRRLRPLHFHRFRRKRGLTQPDTLGRLLELHFAEPVQGPLALGFGCHFGLGLFRPIS